MKGVIGAVFVEGTDTRHRHHLARLVRGLSADQPIGLDSHAGFEGGGYNFSGIFIPIGMKVSVALIHGTRQKIMPG